MIDSVIEKQLISQLDRLDRDRQRQVLDFARFLVMNQPVGTQGKDLLHLAGTLSREDARSMQEAIEEGCGQVDWNEW